ncbi:MAG: CpsD/CapB family tyrosine-protein kinase [Pyrinomonadaceae bacterium]|jgi:capsular exopolysaccharide synthesis family protein|nr:CpsD/CapB family tyrosine-protein kinase [Pyrinomonadaceae bacterium]
MSILKALQKKQLEQPENETSVENVGKIVPFERLTRKNNQPPEMFLEENFKIGVPTDSAFNEQNVSTLGMALPDVRTELKTAGATLNAVALTRPVEVLPTQQKSLPDFVSWEVETDRVEPRLVAITQPHSTYNEEYRSLRTHILHKSQKQKLQSIVVASVGASEGKSVTSLNLSWMLAQTDGVKAIIIDSDLRMPSLSDYLGIETDKGLSDVLSGKASLQDSIIKLEPSGLYLLPGGEARSDVAELLSGPKFKEILRQLRDMFDFIIIDAPPLGIFTDATVLINHADGAIMVVRANRTKYSAVDRILETLPRDRMLGVVLNESEDVLDESHYSYGYYRNSKIRD